MMSSSAPSPAHALAAQFLNGKRVSPRPLADPERYHLAIAACGAGMDHALGEVPVALADYQEYREAFANGAIFTDRRLIARAEYVTCDLHYPAITEARSQSGLRDELTVTAWNQIYKLPGLTECQSTASFLNGMLRVHPQARVPAPRPLVIQTAEDPTGGGGARHGIWSRDPRILPLLGMAFEGHQKGLVTPDLGADMVARAMLYDRTLTFGRGSRDGWWTSPLGAPDLAYAFSRMLGAPYNVTQAGNARALDFRMDIGGDAASAAASTAVGLLALGVVGVGWVSRAGPSLNAIRVKIAPGNASTGFAITEGYNSLSRDWGALLVSLFEGLSRIEGRMLIQRAAFGWAPSPEELDAIEGQALFQKVAESIGEIDLGMYFPKPRPS